MGIGSTRMGDDLSISGWRAQHGSTSQQQVVNARAMFLHSIVFPHGGFLKWGYPKVPLNHAFE